MQSVSRRNILAAALSGAIIGGTPYLCSAQTLGTAVPFAGYRALVCVFLYGGNDSFNMLVPLSAAEYRTYAAVRQSLAVSRDELLPLTRVEGVEYGLHPALRALQRLFLDGRLAFIANVGPLIEPVTKEQVNARVVRLPPQLFSHKDQQVQWQTLQGTGLSASGWAGRIADLFRETVTAQQLPTSVSLSGNALLLSGEETTAYAIGQDGPLKFWGMTNPSRRAAFERILSIAYESIYARSLGETMAEALESVDRMTDALEAAPPLLARFPDTTLGRQLATVARLISVRDVLQMQRQVFFVALGGFDTHDDQHDRHPRLLLEVSEALAAFYRATVELGVSDSVTTFTQSEFGRTLTSNGDGTDHGWAGIQLVLGDSVRGNRIYGYYPPLELDGPNDIGGGRIIPTISADQYAASLARWFGVPEHELSYVAPQIHNFSETDLGFLG